MNQFPYRDDLPLGTRLAQCSDRDPRDDAEDDQFWRDWFRQVQWRWEEEQKQRNEL